MILHVPELCFSEVVMNQARSVCMPLSQLQRVLPAQRGDTAASPQGSREAGAEGGRGTSVSCPPVKRFTGGLGAKQGLSGP